MKRTFIFSEKQIAEVCCDGNPAYLDNLYSKEDEAPNFANQISADGANGDPTTTDDYADDTYSPLQYGIARTAVLREMSKKQWKETFLEEKEHGNQYISNRNFGAQNGDAGRGYGATKQAIYRKHKAEKQLATGTPLEKQKAANTLNNMWNNVDVAETQYNAAKNASKPMQKTIKSAPKDSGNGQAHSIKTPNGGYISQ